MLLTCSLVLAACGEKAAENRGNKLETIREANALLDAFGRQELLRSPETSSRLGLRPEKAGFFYADKLDDRSQAGFERARLLRLETLEDIERFDTVAVSGNTRTTLNIAKASLTSVVDMSAFGHGQVSLGFSRPYAADQLSGAYIELPNLLINRQSVRDKAEALVYIKRLSQVASAIDDDGRRMQAESSVGIVPPDFILALMIAISKQLNQANTAGDEAHPIVAAFENLSLGATGLSPEERNDMIRMVETLIQDDVLPAYARFEQRLENLLPEAPSAPGIWSIRNGEAYYEAALKFYTGQDVKPAALHNEGLKIVSDITAELDTALQEAGYSEGSVLQRLEELKKLPEQFFPNTQEGRDALLATLQERLQATKPQLARLIAAPPRTRLSVAEVPDFLAANAPGGYYQPAMADGTTPAIFFINLRDTAEWPAYSLPTLFYHEAIPGHHFESTIAAEQGNLPLVRQLIWLPVYGEGWALYAEDLASELGVYADDPLGRIGYLQSLIFRAARLVADTGLHHKHWSREEAVTYLVNTTGHSQTSMETEVDRYSVWPGQAVTYMVGRQYIWKLRQRSQTALGDAFDLAAFHNVILSNGPRPLALVEADIDAWIANQKSK